MQIFGYLDDIKDIHNCMLLSKETRDAIFRTPQIMRKMMIITCKYNWNSFLKFINKKGEFIRNIKFEFRGMNEKYMKFALHHVPNLEKLVHCHLDEDLDIWDMDVNYSSVEEFPEPADLSQLRNLFLVDERFEKLTRITKNIKKLETLNCWMEKEESLENFTNFIVKQNNLKELKLEYLNFEADQKFPSRDISSEVKFQLKILKLNKCYNDNPHFLTFFKNQAEKLEILELVNPPDENICKVIYKMCKNLKELSLQGSETTVYYELYPEYKLESLKYLKEAYFSTPKLIAACEKIPNLESIKCREFEDVSGIFENICNLELETIKVNKFQNVKLPNLKKLFVCNFENSINDDFQNFIKNIPNIEYFKIGGIEINFNNAQILQHLTKFQKLRNFEAIFYEIIEYYDFIDDPIEYKISINFEKKTVQYLEDLLHEEESRMFFKDFEFIKSTCNDFWSWDDHSFPN